MLVLNRQVNQFVLIGDTIRVLVVAIEGDKVRLGIEAPPSVPVDRKEVRDRKNVAAIQRMGGSK